MTQDTRMQYLSVRDNAATPLSNSRTKKPSKRIYIKMKPPICVGSERINWGANSGRYIISVSVNMGPCWGKRWAYLAVWKLLPIGTGFHDRYGLCCVTVRRQLRWWWSCWEVTQKTMLHKRALMPTGKEESIAFFFLIAYWESHEWHGHKHTSTATSSSSMTILLDVLSVLWKTPTLSCSTICWPWNQSAFWRASLSTMWVSTW